MSYGVNEVLLASVLGAAVFSIFAAQPLVIVGVTGRCFNNSISPTPMYGLLHNRPSHKLYYLYVLDRLVSNLLLPDE
ncbi:hypothetical protein GP486_005841 [Trichoglossum hirsutum]|uniref:Uncharacterized protein n=1 Tax=Trichoglossum hirsutum TaxID=265104 RepID=A0A9P8L8G8_9PEZI|nr:hypothetical protein GP486_005841 [Trichoglossum hirsutum]